MSGARRLDCIRAGTLRERELRIVQVRRSQPLDETLRGVDGHYT